MWQHCVTDAWGVLVDSNNQNTAKNEDQKIIKCDCCKCFCKHCKCKESNDDKEEKTDPLQSVDYQMLFTELSFNAGLETDRQLLTLSTAGLGLLLALVSNKGDAISIDGLSFVIFLLAAFAFVYTILVLIKVLDENKKHIVAISQGVSGSDSEILANLERNAKLGFFLAIVMTIALFVLIVSGGDLKWTKIASQKVELQTQVQLPTTVHMDSRFPGQSS